MEVITILVNSKALARACVVLELAQVWDWQSQLLAVPRNPVLLHLLLVDRFDEDFIDTLLETCNGRTKKNQMPHGCKRALLLLSSLAMAQGYMSR